MNNTFNLVNLSDGLIKDNIIISSDLVDNGIASKQIKLLTEFDDLSKLFKKTDKKNINKLIKIINNMRIIQGKIIKLFYSQLKSTGETDEEYYILGTLDSSYLNIRNVISAAEASLSKLVEFKDETNNNLSVDFLDNNSIAKDIDTEIDMDKLLDDSGFNLKKSFNDFGELKPNIPVIVLFYADWCGHCKVFKPIWEEFKKITDETKINIVKTNNENLVQKYNINGVPTVMYFNNSNEKPIMYNGNRTVNGLADFINEIFKYSISKPIANDYFVGGSKENKKKK